MSLGTDQLCWEPLGQVGHPGQSWSGDPLSQICPGSSCLWGTSLRAPQEVGALQTGAQTDPGAEKKDGKTQEKTHPLLRLFLLMKSRALPKPEGMEEGLSKTRLRKHSPCCRAGPHAGRGGVKLTILVSPGGKDLLAVAPLSHFS